MKFFYLFLPCWNSPSLLALKGYRGLILSMKFFYLFLPCWNSPSLLALKGYRGRAIGGLYYQYIFFTFSAIILGFQNTDQQSDFQFLVDVPSCPYVKDVDK